MKLVDVPVMNPRRCIFCQGNTGEPHVDTMFDHPFPPVGRVYVCLKHAMLIATAAGFAEGAELAKLKDAVKAAEMARSQNVRDEQRIAEYRERLNEAHAELGRAHEETAVERQRADQAEATLRDVRASIDATASAMARVGEAA